MSWVRSALWVLMSALVLVVLGGYVFQWYKERTLCEMLNKGEDDSSFGSKPPPLIPVVSSSSIFESPLETLETGYVD